MGPGQGSRLLSSHSGGLAAYVDASAGVKLFKVEPGSDALRGALHHYEVLVSSELVRIEMVCAARRLGPGLVTHAREAVEMIELVPYTPRIGERILSAQHRLRALDAIHLATALGLSHRVGTLIAYDLELCAAARAEGFAVLSPEWPE